MPKLFKKIERAVTKPIKAADANHVLSSQRHRYDEAGGNRERIANLVTQANTKAETAQAILTRIQASLAAAEQDSKISHEEGQQSSPLYGFKITALAGAKEIFKRISELQGICKKRQEEAETLRGKLSSLAKDTGHNADETERQGGIAWARIGTIEEIDLGNALQEMDKCIASLQEYELSIQEEIARFKTPGGSETSADGATEERGEPRVEASAIIETEQVEPGAEGVPSAQSSSSPSQAEKIAALQAQLASIQAMLAALQQSPSSFSSSSPVGQHTGGPAGASLVLSQDRSKPAPLLLVELAGGGGSGQVSSQSIKSEPKVTGAGVAPK